MDVSEQTADHGSIEPKHKNFLRSTWPIHWRQAGEFVLAYVVITAVWSAVGWALTHPWKNSVIARIDLHVARWFASDNTHSTGVMAKWGANMAGTITKVTVTAVVVLVLLFLWKRWFESTVIAMTLILEAACFVTITSLVGRPRPPVRHLENSPISSSFPSGHAAAAAAYGAIAVVIFWHSRKRAVRIATVVITGLICVTVAVCRMYMGMHYLSDIIAGLLLGTTCVVVTVLIMRGSPEAAVVEHPDHHGDRTLGSADATVQPLPAH